MAQFPDTPSFTGFNTPSRIEADIADLQLTGTMDRDVWAKRGAKRKSRQVSPPPVSPSPEGFSPLLADACEPQPNA